MKSDMKIQEDVQAELRWEPYLQSTEIGVAVKNGIVTLSGKVDAYSKKVAAERAAKRVSGVKAVAEEIEVGLPTPSKRTDTELAEAILNALRWHTAVQEDKIKISVEDGHVKLEGQVDWEYQRNNAKNAIEYLMGVKSVNNLITVKRLVSPADIQQKIQSAFQRSATVDASHVTAEVTDGKVMLKGYVRSWAEKQDAISAAWKGLGVTKVEDKLEIRLPEYSYED